MKARVAVVGHVEWVDFLPVPHLPRPGELLHSEGAFGRPAGGGGVACGVLAQAGAEVELYCALGRGEHAQATRSQLHGRGVRVHDAARQQPMRRAIALLEPGGDRLIVTVGERLQPAGSDPLPWASLRATDAVYFTAGDASALEHSRSARVLVATPRAGNALSSGPVLDALVYSAHDEYESRTAERLSGCARILVATDGARGGSWTGASSGYWTASTPPGPIRDSYGCGDAFAAVLAFALGAGETLQSAVALGARWGARMLSRTGAP